jgi:hypothetical protein
MKASKERASIVETPLGHNDQQKSFIERFAEHLSKVDELTLVVLKGHLLLEESLDKIITTFVFHPEQLADAWLTFAQRVAIARSMSLDEFGNTMWELILAINALRNDLAHSLNSPRRLNRLARVKELYFRECVDLPDIEHDRLLKDQHIISLALALSYGFLEGFQKEVNRFKEWVSLLDRTVNRHRYPRSSPP